MLKFFNIINTGFVAITIITHLGGCFFKSFDGYGISLQFFLGIYQILFAIALMTGNYQKFETNSIRLIGYYWLSVFIFIFFAYLLNFMPSTITTIVVIVIIPMIIACYQVYAINKIIQNINN
jgi:hypothetical protein